MTNLFDDFDPKFKPGADTFKPGPINFNEASISIDVQDYIDDAVKKLRDSVASQVETNLQALLKDAFLLTIEPLRLQPVVAAGLWHSFLQKLALSAEMAVDEIEDRK